MCKYRGFGVGIKCEERLVLGQEFMNTDAIDISVSSKRFEEYFSSYIVKLSFEISHFLCM